MTKKNWKIINIDKYETPKEFQIDWNEIDKEILGDKLPRSSDKWWVLERFKERCIEDIEKLFSDTDTNKNSFDDLISARISVNNALIISNGSHGNEVIKAKKENFSEILNFYLDKLLEEIKNNDNQIDEKIKYDILEQFQDSFWAGQKVEKKNDVWQVLYEIYREKKDQIDPLISAYKRENKIEDELDWEEFKNWLNELPERKRGKTDVEWGIILGTNMRNFKKYDKRFLNHLKELEENEILEPHAEAIKEWLKFKGIITSNEPESSKSAETKQNYQTLNLEETASVIEIRKAYRKLSLQYHPKKKDSSEESQQKFKDIQDAYNALIESKGGEINHEVNFGFFEAEIAELNQEIIELKEIKELEKENLKKIIEELQKQLNNLKAERLEQEEEWTSSERTKKLLQEQQILKNELKRERKNKRFWMNLNENPKEVIQIKLEEKKREQEFLKLLVKNKLGNQAYLLENLLERAENFYLVVFEGADWTDRTFLKFQDKLQEAKDKLFSKLSGEEIEELCEMQTEIFKLEIQLKEESEKKKFVERIETVIKQIWELEQKRKNWAEEVDIWKENYANQKTLNAHYREELIQKQSYIKELEAEKAINYENFMDEYGKTMEDFYKRQGDYKEHLQDYVFSKKIREENEQLKKESEQMEKQLEVKIEIPPKQK